MAALALVQQEVAGEQYALHVVQGVLIHREAAAAALANEVHDLLVGGVDVHGGDVLAVDHAVPGVHVVELEDVLDHLLLVRLDGALLLADVHHLEDVLLGDQLARIGVAQVEGPEDQPPQRRGQPGQRREYDQRPLGHGGHAVEQLLPPVGRQIGRHHAAEHEREHAKGNQQAQRRPAAGGKPQPGEQKRGHAAPQPAVQRDPGDQHQNRPAHLERAEGLLAALDHAHGALRPGGIALRLAAQLALVQKRQTRRGQPHHGRQQRRNDDDDNGTKRVVHLDKYLPVIW